MTMTEMLIKDARTINNPAVVAVKHAEWGGYYVTILGGRVGPIHQQQADAESEAETWRKQIFG